MLGKLSNINRFRRIKKGVVFVLVILMVLTQVPASFATSADAPAEAGSETSDSGGKDPAGISEPSADDPASEPVLNHTVSFVLPEGVRFVLPDGNEITSNLWTVQAADGSSIALDQIPLLSELPDGKLFLGWLLGAGTAPVVSADIPALSVTGNLTFTAAFEEAPLEVSPFALSDWRTTSAQTAIGGDTGKIVLLGPDPALDRIVCESSTAGLASAAARLQTAGGGVWLLYIGGSSAASTINADANTRNTLFAASTADYLVITGAAADPAPATPTPATAEPAASTLNFGGSTTFGSDVEFRNIRYTFDNVYMNGHNLTLGNQSWATTATNYYGGAASGTVTGNPTMTVWSTSVGVGAAQFVGGMQTGTLNGNAAINIHNTSGNVITVYGGGQGSSATNKATVNGNVTTIIDGMATSAGGLNSFFGAGPYCDVTGKVTTRVSGPGRMYASTTTGVGDTTNFWGGADAGNIGSLKDSAELVLDTDVDFSQYTNGGMHFAGANRTSGFINGSIKNRVRAGGNNRGALAGFDGGGGYYTSIGGSYVTNNTTRTSGTGKVTVNTVAIETAATFRIYGNITSELRGGCFTNNGLADNITYIRGAGYGGYVRGTITTDVGTESVVYSHALATDATGAYADPARAYKVAATAGGGYWGTVGTGTNFDIVGGGGQTSAGNSQVIEGDTILNMRWVIARWTYGSGFGGVQVGDSTYNLMGGIVDTLEGSGYDMYAHKGNAYANVYQGEVDWFYAGGGWGDDYIDGSIRSEVFDRPRTAIDGTVLTDASGKPLSGAVINASMGGHYGTDQGQISGDSDVIIHGGDFSGVQRYGNPNFSPGATNQGDIYGNTSMTMDLRGNQYGFKMQQGDTVRITAGRPYGAGGNQTIGTAANNTSMTLNIFTDDTGTDLLLGTDIYGTGGTDAGYTRASNLNININAPGSNLGVVYASQHSNINGSNLRLNTNINLVAAASLKGLSAGSTADYFTSAIVNGARAAGKGAVLKVGPQNGLGLSDILGEWHSTQPTDGYPHRINVVGGGAIRNFTEMEISRRLLVAESGDVKQSGNSAATDAAISQHYQDFGDVTIHAGSGTDAAGFGIGNASNRIIIGKFIVQGSGSAYVQSQGQPNQIIATDYDSSPDAELVWLKTGTVSDQALSPYSTWFGLARAYKVVTINTNGRNADHFTPANFRGVEPATGKTFIGDSSVPATTGIGYGVATQGTFFKWNVVPGSDGVSLGKISYHLDGTFNSGNFGTTKPAAGSYLNVYGDLSTMDKPTDSGRLAIPTVNIPSPVGYPKFTFTPDADRGEWYKAIDTERSDHYVVSPVGKFDTRVSEQPETDYNDPSKSRIYVWQSAGDDNQYSFDITADYTSVPELTAKSVILTESAAQTVVNDGTATKPDADIINAIRTVTDVHSRPFLTDDIDTGAAVTALGTPLAGGEKSRTYGPITYQTHETDGGDVSLSRQVFIIVVPDDAEISPDGKAALTAADADMSISDAQAITAQNGDAPDEVNIDWWTGASVVVITDDGSGGLPVIEQKNADLYAAGTMVDAFKAVTGATVIDLEYSYTYQSFELQRSVKARIEADTVTSARLIITKSAVNTRTNAPVISSSDNRVGDILHFTLTAANPVLYSKWENVLFTDSLDSNLQIVSGSVKVNGLADAGNNSLNSRPMGDGSATDSANTLKLEFDAEIVSGYGTSFNNTFSVTGTAESGPVGKSSNLSDDSTFVTIDVQEDDPTKSLGKHAANITATDGKNHVGDTLKYTLTAENKATNLSDWKDVTIIDDIPEGLDLSGTLASLLIDGKSAGSQEWIDGGWTASFGTGTDARKLSVYIGDIANSEVHTVTFTADILPSAAGNTLSNTAAAQTGDDGEDDDPEADPPDQPDITSADPVKSIEKTHALKGRGTIGAAKNPAMDDGAYYIGDIITYTVEIENTQTDYSVWQVGDFTDNLKIGGGDIFGAPDNVEIVYDGGTATAVDTATAYDAASGILTVTVGDLISKGASGTHKKATITFDAEILPAAAGANIVNKASVSDTDPGIPDGEDGEPLVIEEADPVSYIFKDVKNLTAIDDGRGTNKIGDILEYSITVSNKATEASTWAGVTIIDILDANLGTSDTLGSVMLAENGGSSAPLDNNANKYFGVGSDPEPRTLYVYAGDINNGESKTLTFQVRILPGAAGETVTNTAYAGGKNSVGQTNVEKTDPVPRVSKIAVNTTQGTRTTNNAGDLLKYTIKVANDSPNMSVWENVVLTDYMDPGLEIFDADGVIENIKVFKGETQVWDGATNSGTLATAPALDNDTRILNVQLGDINNGEEYTIEFFAGIGARAAGTTIHNTAEAGNTNFNTNANADTEVAEATPVKIITKTHENLTAQEEAAAIGGGATARTENRIGDKIRYTLTLVNGANGKSTWKLGDVGDNLTLGTDAYDWSETLKTLTVQYGQISAAQIGTGNDYNYTYGAMSPVIPQGSSVTDIGDNSSAPTKGAGNFPTLNGGFLTIPLDDLVVDYLGNSPNGVVVTFDAVLKASTAGMTITNKAGTTPDSQEATDALTVIKVKPEPVVTKSVKNLTSRADGSFHIGDVIEYTVVVRNNATAKSTWENVVLKDTLSNLFDTDPVASAGYGGTLSSVEVDGQPLSAGSASWDDTVNELSVPLGNIEQQQYKTVTFTVIIENAISNVDPIHNTATAEGLYGVTQINGTSNNIDFTVDDDEPLTSLTKERTVAAKAGNPADKVSVGDTVTYTLSLKNSQTTNSKWSVGAVTDNLYLGANGEEVFGTPANVTIKYGNDTPIPLTKDAQDNGYTYANGLLTVPVSNLVTGSYLTNGTGTNEAVVTFDVELLEAAAGQNIKNIAAAGVETGVDKDDGLEIEEVAPVKDLQKTFTNKTAEANGRGGINKVGDVLEYSITASNQATASSTWKGVTIIDKLPDGLDISGISPLVYRTEKNGTVTNLREGADVTASIGTTADIGDWWYTTENGKQVLHVYTGDIRNDERINVKFEVVIAGSAAGTTISNTASANGDAEKTVDGPGGVLEDDAVPAFEKSHVNKTAADEQRTNYKVDDILTYTLTLENTQPNKSTWVVGNVTDDLRFGSGVDLFDTTGTLGSLTIDYQNENGAAGGNAGSVAVTTASLSANGVLTVPVDDLQVKHGSGTYSKAVITFDVKLADGAADKTGLRNIAATTDGTSASDGTKGAGGFDVDKKDPVKFIEKSVENITAKADGNRAENKVGDRLRYTITVKNDAKGTSVWPDVFVKDTLSEYLGTDPMTNPLFGGTVQSLRIDGKTASGFGATVGWGSDPLTQGYDAGTDADTTLIVGIGDIANSVSRIIEFDTIILPGAAGRIITNQAITNTASADNDTATGGGTSVDKANPDRVFTKSSAKVGGRMSDNRSGQLDPDIYPGDTIEYTLTLRNEQSLDSVWKDVFVTDDLKLGGKDVFGTANAAASAAILDSLKIYYDGGTAQSVAATINTGVLGIPVGDLQKTGTANNTAVIKFRVVVAQAAVGETLQNTAITRDGVAAADGVTGHKVKQLQPKPGMTKSAVNVTAAAEGRGTNKIGDTIRYTIAAGNDAAASAPWKNVVVSDPLSGLFEIGAVLGTVRVDGTAPASENAYFGTGTGAGTLYVKLGDVQAGQSKTITFDVVIGPLAAGQTLNNTAAAMGDDDDNEASDGSGLGILNRYTVSYDINGGTGQIPGAGSYDEGGTATIGSDMPARSGYTFLGWSEDPNAKEASYPAGANISNIARNYSLYAIWSQDLPPAVPDPEPQPEPQPQPQPQPQPRPVPVTPPVAEPVPQPVPQPVPTPIPTVDPTTPRPSAPTPAPRPPAPTPTLRPPAPTPTPEPTPMPPAPAPAPAPALLAPPVTPEVSVPSVNLFGSEVPLYAKNGEGWAFINLILMLASIIIALIALVLFFRRRKHFAPRLGGVLLAVIAVLVFFVTEDTSLRVVLFNSWSIVHAILLAIIIFLTMNPRNKKIVEETDGEAEDFFAE